MAGNAKTSKFLLTTATVMVGPMDDLYSLNTVDHSIGLVKNVQIQADPQFIELTQGIRNQVVMSVRNADGLKISAEVYEFTPANLAYAAGLDGGELSVAQTLYELQSVAEGEDTEVVLTGDVGAAWGVGKYGFVQKGLSDYVHIFKSNGATVSTDTTVALATGFDIPANLEFPAGSRVGLVDRLDFGGQEAQENFALKIVGLLPEDKTPFTIMVPKVKITRGLSLAFASDNFTNMPFEFTPYGLVAEDTMYSEFGDAVMSLFPR